MPPEDMVATTVFSEMFQGEAMSVSEKSEEQNPLRDFLLPLRFFKSEESTHSQVHSRQELLRELEHEDNQRLPVFRNLMKRKKESSGDMSSDYENWEEVSTDFEKAAPCDSQRLPIFKSITKRCRSEYSKIYNIQKESTDTELNEKNLSAYGVNDPTYDFELESQRTDSPTQVALDFDRNDEEQKAQDHLNPVLEGQGVIRRELPSIPFDLQQLPFYYMAFLTHYPYVQGVRIPAIVRFKSILSNRPPEWLYPCTVFYAHDLDLVVFKEPDHVLTDVEFVRLQQHVDKIYNERCRILFPGPGEGTALIRLPDISERCCIIYKYGGHLNRWEDYDYEEINRWMNLPIVRWRDDLLRFEYVPMPVEQLPIPMRVEDEFSDFDDDSGIGESDVEEIARRLHEDLN
ncbi:unnamed protein product [Caenorhabditis nigoni]